MYKRIHHHITEEHFSHPHAAHLAAMVNNAHRVLPHPHKSGQSITPSALTFLGEAISTWGTLAGRIRHYVISAAAGVDDLPITRAKMVTDINKIGNILIPYYDQATIELFESSLQTLMSAICDQISAVKANAVTPAIQTATTNAILAFASVLNKVNPKSWPASAVTSVWTSIANGLFAQTSARIAKDWEKDLTLADDTYYTLVNPKLGNSTSFADIFADGVINQFPSKFVS